MGERGKENQEMIEIRGAIAQYSLPRGTLTEAQVARLASLADCYVEPEIGFDEKGNMCVHYWHGEVEGDMMEKISPEGQDLKQYGWGADGAEPIEFADFIGR